LGEDTECIYPALNLVANKYVTMEELKNMNLPEMIELYAVIDMNSDYKTAYNMWLEDQNKG
jgi:hypothetical protein